jgi:magnesium transporter
MIRSYGCRDDRCEVLEGEAALHQADAAAWLDLLQPSEAEETAVEAVIGADIPTREEMAEIEISSRLYHNPGATVMTAPVLIKSGAYPETADVTFVLTPQRLVTVRYAEPVAFATFADAARRDASLCAGPREAFAGLLDAIIDRVADVLEDTGRELDALSREVFVHDPAPRDLKGEMRRLGRSGEIVSKARESLVGLARLIGFARGLQVLREDEGTRRTLSMLGRDVETLLEHAASLAAKITFLLDALLGLINIEQNAIIKTFSVVAVMFLPPTLIASIYGMNFEHMPELGWPFGYPLALAAMVASMIAPYLFFKRKGWI